METPRAGALTIIFKSTCQCNINCDYCYDKSQRDKYKCQVVSPEIIDHTAKLASEYATNVTWTWHGGESTLLGKEFYLNSQDVFFKHYNAKFTQTLQSNGVLLLDDYSWFDEFKDYDISIGISFDMYTQALRMGHKYTGDEILEKYIKMLNYISDLQGYPCGALTVVHNKNVDKLIDMYEMMKHRLPGFGLSYNFVFDAYGNESHALGISSEQYLHYYPDFVRHLVFDKSPNSLGERSTLVYISNLLGHPTYRICSSSDCRRKWIGIQPDGSISYCDRELDEDYNIGNILDFESIQDVYNSDGYIKLMNDIDIRFENQCIPCPYFKYCNGGCHSNHASGNRGKVDKCNQDQCFEFKHNFITVLSVLQEITVDTVINRNILDMILASPSLIKCEVEYFLNEEGIQQSLNLDIEALHANPDTIESSREFKLLQLFTHAKSYSINLEAGNGRPETLRDSLDSRRALFNKLRTSNRVEINELL